MKIKFLACSFSIIIPLGLGLALSGLTSCSPGGLNLSGLSISDTFNAGKSIFEASRSVPPMQQYFLGRAVSANLLEKYPVSRNAGLNRYLTLIGRSLASYSALPETYGGYHFRALQSDEINAFAAPGGFIFVTTGLIKLLPNEDALAGVLAHEISHVVHEDGVSAISNQKYTEAALIVGKQAAQNLGNSSVALGASLLGNQVNGLVENLITKGYSRSQEYAADEGAIQLMQTAGYNPYGYIQALQILEKQSEGNSHGLFSTHPDPEDRLDNIFDEFDNLPDSPPQVVERDRRFAQQIKSLR